MKLGKLLIWGCLLLRLSVGFAQPYIAAEGFDRPFAVASSQTTPDVLSVNDNGTVFAYWRDRDGLYRKSLEKKGGATEQLITVNGLRDMEAAQRGSDFALLTVIQDRTTGKTVHKVRWNEQEQTVLETLAPGHMALSLGPAGPIVAYSQTIDATDRLFIWRWNEGAKEVYQSDLSLEKIDLALDDSDHLYLSWLEGSNDRAAVGFSQSNWTTNYLSLGEEDSAEPVSLGPASNRGIQYVTRLMPANSAMYLAWRSEDEGLNLARLGGETLRLEPGYPVGIADNYFYWTSGASIRRLELSAGAETLSNVIWAPTTIELADLSFSNGKTYLSWYGGSSSNYQIYGANNVKAISLSWQDRLAKALQIIPYGLWQGIGSRLILSLLVGILLSLGFAPLYWVLSLLGARLVKGGQAKPAGIVIAWLGMLTLLIVAYFRSSTPLTAPGVLSIPVALGLASLIVWLRLRHLDTENQTAILLGSLLTTFVSIALLSLIHFPGWVEPYISGF
ncbi:MAG: hypothetical protein KC422_03915 [Trueperaceae bacterium]|nr:hypothetical protein [Trueperaceae bacterium]